MNRIEIDCQTEQVKLIELSLLEEASHLNECKANGLRAEAEKKKQIKNSIAKYLAELKEMKQNTDIFDDNDLAEKQAEIDELKTHL